MPASRPAAARIARAKVSGCQAAPAPVIAGGVNIYPREIEELLFTHPAIADVAVVGVPDATWGERLKIFAVLRAPLTAEDVNAFCAGKLAPYKIPKELEAIAQLPRNANGKVLKTELRVR